MGTRAIYTFEDGDTERHVFIHYDGYPSGAASYFRQWLEAGTSWPLPRFEADEAAAGFIAAVKRDPGNVRICSARFDYCDVEFGYRVSVVDGVLRIQVARTDYWGEAPAEHILYDGPMSDFIAQAQELDRAA